MGDCVSVVTFPKPKAKPTVSKPTRKLDRLPDVEIKDDLTRWADDGGPEPPDAD